MSIHARAFIEDFGRAVAIQIAHVRDGDVILGKVEDDRVVYREEDRVPEGQRIEGATLYLSQFEAEKLAEALLEVVRDVKAPHADQREDYLHERGRVDKMIDALIGGSHGT